MTINLETVKAITLPWLVVVALFFGGILFVGGGSFPWQQRAHVLSLEKEVSALGLEPQQEVPFQLPTVESSQGRLEAALTLLDGIATETGITLGEIRPASPLTEGKVMKTPLYLTAHGSLDSAANFLYVLEEEYPGFLIEELRISGKDQELELQLKLVDRALGGVGP